MSVLTLSFYDEDDPNGTALGTLDDTDLLAAEFRVALHGLGSGMFKINRNHADAGLIAEDRLVKITLPSVDASPIFAFWLKEGDFTLISRDEEGGEVLTFGGPGIMYILALARLYHSSLVSDQPSRGSADKPGIWWWENEPYGAILTRIIEEGRENPFPDAAAAGSALEHVTIDFDRTTDSDSVAWPNIDAEYEERIGTDMLQVAERLREAGDLYYVMDPDLSFHAHQTYGRDLTGAFGAGTVRFEKGVNILTELKRGIGARANYTHLLQMDADGNYSTEVLSGWTSAERKHWGYFEATQTNDDTLLNAIGADTIRRSRTHLESLELEWTPGFDPANGRYMPGPSGTNGHVWVGDSVTLDTGSGDHEYDAAAQLVTAIRVTLAEAADDTSSDTAARSLHCVAELNYEDVRSARWNDAAPGGGPNTHQHPPNPALCEPGTVSGFAPVGLVGAVCSSSATDTLSEYPDWVAGGFYEEKVEITVPRTIPVGSTLLASVSRNTLGDNETRDITFYDEQGNTWVLDGQSADQGSSEIVAEIWRCSVTTQLEVGDYIRYAGKGGTGANDSISLMNGRCIGVFEFSGAISNPTVSASATGFHLSGGTHTVTTPAGDLVFGAINAQNRTVTGDEDWTDAIPSTTVTGAGVNRSGTFAQYLLEAGASTWTTSNSDSDDYSAFAIAYDTDASVAVGGDGHPSIVGISPKAKRCDSTEHFHASRAPGVNDDASFGMPNNTLWINDLTGEMWLLLDNTDGAADWLQVGSSPDHTHTATSLGWFDVTTYGALGDGTTDDTDAINDAIAALNAAGRGVLYFPAGNYLVSDGLDAITVPATIRGDGPGGGTRDMTTYVSRITCSDGAVTVLDIQAHSYVVESLHFECSDSTPTAGGAIAVTANGDHGRFHRVTVDGFYIGIDVQEGAEWSMSDCHIQSPALYGIKIRHVDLPDGGDWAISNTQIIANDRTATAAIRQESGGGGKISNVKINGSSGETFTDGIQAVFTDLNTSILMLSNVSIENVTGDAVDISTAGTATFSQIVIDGLQVGLYSNNTGRAVKIAAAAAGGTGTAGGISGVSIDGLMALTDGTARAAVELTNLDIVTLGELTLLGFNARYTGSGNTNLTDSGAGATELDDLSDVTITSVAANDQLQYVGGAWVNNGRRWEPVVTDPGTGPELVFDGSGDIVMTFVEYS